MSTHVPCGYSINVNNEFKDNHHTYYRGNDSMEKFAKEILRIGKEIASEEKHVEIFLTEDEKLKHEECKKCHICDKPFNTNKKSKYFKSFKKVRDHCHYTGKYSGAAHSLCNLRYQEQRVISIVIQNGSKYDFHLLIKELAKKIKSQVKCIGENIETYKTFSLLIEVEIDEVDEKEKLKTKTYNLRFIDSCRFMNISLDMLVDNLSEINNKECKKCKERTKTTEYCEFVKLDKTDLCTNV